MKNCFSISKVVSLYKKNCIHTKDCFPYEQRLQLNLFSGQYTAPCGVHQWLTVCSGQSPAFHSDSPWPQLGLWHSRPQYSSQLFTKLCQHHMLLDCFLSAWRCFPISHPSLSPRPPAVCSVSPLIQPRTISVFWIKNHMSKDFLQLDDSVKSEIITIITLPASAPANSLSSSLGSRLLVCTEGTTTSHWPFLPCTACGF